MKFSKVCVLGLGYIGLPTSCMFATNGVKVVGVDVNQTIVSSLQAGKVHIYEPGLRTLVEDALAEGQLEISSTPEPADAFIIAVPTPFYDDKKADMRAVTSATEAIVPHLRKGNLVVLESTSPPLTTVNLVQPILEKSGLKAGVDFLLVYSPERVLPGQILTELVKNARVIGGITPESAEAGRDLYRTFVRGEIILTNATTAEMVKLMENTYRDVNIAIANEFSRLADRFGVNVWEAISIANLHPRVKILTPGPGVGGHCISVDPWFLVEAAPDLTPLIHTSRLVNDSQPHYAVSIIERAVGDLKGKRIAALGLSFKADVDDIRESPAIDVARLLQKAGAHVVAYEPFRADLELEGLEIVNSLAAVLQNADVIVLQVGHTAFKTLNPQVAAQLTTARVAVDLVGAWQKDAWQAAGFDLRCLGVGQA